MSVTVAFNWGDCTKGTVRIEDKRVEQAKNAVEQGYGVQLSDGEAARHVLQQMFDTTEGSRLVVMHKGEEYGTDYIDEKLR